MNPPPGSLEVRPTSVPALTSRWNQDVAGWCIASLLVAAALVFLSGPVFAHDALKDDHGVCPEVPVAARATCLDHRGFTILVGPVELALVFTLAAALVAGITDRRPVFRAAVVVVSALLISVFVWFQLGQELASRYEVAGAFTWLGVVAVLMSWPVWRTWQRVVIGVVAIVSCLLVISDAISAY